jgi:glutathione S-transferase
MTPLSIPTMPTLYHIKWWSSSRPLSVLMELGVVGAKPKNSGGGDNNKPSSFPVAIQTITYQQLKEDLVLTKINPQRRLPFFYDPQEDLSLNESGGLVEYLLETYDADHKLHPPPAPLSGGGDKKKKRAEFLKLLHFGPATVYHNTVPILFPKDGAKDGTNAQAAKEYNRKKREWHEVVAPTLEQALDTFGGPFLLGNEFTAVDGVLSYDIMTAHTSSCSKELFGPHPQVEAYHKKKKKNLNIYYL